VLTVSLMRVVVFEIHKYIASSAARGLTYLNHLVVGHSEVDYLFRKLDLFRGQRKLDAYNLLYNYLIYSSFHYFGLGHLGLVLIE